MIMELEKDHCQRAPGLKSGKRFLFLSSGLYTAVQSTLLVLQVAYSFKRQICTQRIISSPLDLCDSLEWLDFE